MIHFEGDSISSGLTRGTAERIVGLSCRCCGKWIEYEPKEGYTPPGFEKMVRKGGSKAGQAGMTSAAYGKAVQDRVELVFDEIRKLRDERVAMKDIAGMVGINMTETTLLKHYHRICKKRGIDAYIRRGYCGGLDGEGVKEASGQQALVKEGGRRIGAYAKRGSRNKDTLSSGANG
jgi:hypothetical protein